jgi:alpha-beta hydrolase superfamily lysophospholipase
MREEDFQSAGGVRIHMREWLPDGAPRAVVVICHGVNSHGGQHALTAEQLAPRGFAVYAVDLRGRGKSEGPRFYVEDIAEYGGRARADRDRQGLIRGFRQTKDGPDLSADDLRSLPQVSSLRVRQVGGN